MALPFFNSHIIWQRTSSPAFLLKSMQGGEARLAFASPVNQFNHYIKAQPTNT